MSTTFEDRSGFSEVVTQPAGIGDNSAKYGVLPTPVDLRLTLRERHAAALKKAADLVAAEPRIPTADGALDCPDENWEKKLSDIVRQIQGAHKSLETARTAEKQVFDDLADAVHGLFREQMDLLVDPRPRGVNGLKHRIEAAMTRFKLKREAEARRKAQEEADQRRAEEDKARREADAAAAEAQRLADEAARKRKPENKLAAEQAAQAASTAAAEAAARATTAGEQRSAAEDIASAPAADLTRARGGYSVSSLQEFLDYRDTERAKLPAITLWPYLPADAIEKAIRGYMVANADPIKAGLKNQKQPLPGVVFFINHRTGVR